MTNTLATQFVKGFQAALADPDTRSVLRKLMRENGLLGGVFSDLEIKEARADGHIIIEPYVEDDVRGSSVDVTLWRDFYVTDKIENQLAYNPYSAGDVARYFQRKEAMSHAEWRKKHKGLHFEDIDDGQEIIVLKPHERTLCVTSPFIGINPPGTSEMRARSTTGRNGIVVCKDAGWGDPGYINRWTMEIQNDNEEWIPLLVGAPIAQIVFHHTGPVERSYASDGKYQSGNDVDQLIADWRPEQMLPKGYKDLQRIARFVV